MSALDVIPVPGYPGWYARRCAVEAWQRAGSPPIVSAGRLYADQKYLYDGWDARLPGFNPADNPADETQRLAHVRMVAFDLKNPTRDRAAMVRAGFQFPYDYEPWHAELPNVKSYAIVRSIPTPAAENAAPIVPKEDDNMPKYVQVKDDRGNFAIVGPDGVGRVLNGAALRGAEKIAKAANGGELPEVELSGEEWDSGTLYSFGAP